MTAEELISQLVPPLKTSDTGRKAIQWMNELHVRHLPIVNNSQLLGLITEEDVFSFNDPEEPLGAHELSLSKPFVREDDHIYDIIKAVVTLQLSIMPVIDYDGNYLGVITVEDLLKHFAVSGSLTDPGTIIVLGMSKRDYVLSEIARIVESENAKILNAHVTSSPNSTQIEVTLKLNSNNVESITATFERMGYNIRASFNESDYMDSLKERYDSLMNYLNV